MQFDAGPLASKVKAPGNHQVGIIRKPKLSDYQKLIACHPRVLPRDA